MDTIADGLRTRLVGTRPWAILDALVERDVLSVTDADIRRAVHFAAERLKMVVEPSGAVGLAALLNPDLVKRVVGERIAVIVSGGNVDLAAFAILLS